MIFNNPDSWQELQEKISLILNQVGFVSTVNKKIKTPRGEIEVDVYAIDTVSIDKIVYIIECKNWKNKIPQTVIHSFTTVMHEIGANIGYLISKVGLQKGASEYSNSTNIIGLTFTQFQEKYFELWFENHFCTIIDNVADSFIQYTEPINSRRHRFYSSLDKKQKSTFNSLMEKYSEFSFLIVLLCSKSKKNKHLSIQFVTKSKLLNLNLLKIELSKYSGETFNSTCYYELIDELTKFLNSLTEQFNRIFGKDIFKDNVNYA